MGFRCASYIAHFLDSSFVFRLKNAMMMFAACDMNVLMMDYRGFGT
jgi:hypothetical protein